MRRAGETGITRDILFVSSNFPPVIGGSAMVYDQICRHAADRVVALGAHHDYRTGAAWPVTDAPYLIHRITYLRPPIMASGRHRLSRILSLFTSDLLVMLTTLWTILRLRRRYGCRVVCIGELIHNGWLVFPLRYLFGLRVILYTHGEEVAQDADSMLARWRGVFLRHADGIIAVSLFCKGEIIARFGLAADTVQLVINGVDLDRFKRLRKIPVTQPETGTERRLILSVSRLVPRKGHADLIRALPEVVALFPNILCIIIGDGPEAGHLQALIAARGLEAHCRLLGPLPADRLNDYYQKSEIFALPCQTQPDGDTEGYGLVFLEANACGLPVVGGAAGGTIEAILDDETGLIVDGRDPHDIALALLRLLADRGLARRLGDTGWRRAQHMGWKEVATAFLAACDDTAGKSRFAYPNAVVPSPAAERPVQSPAQLLVTVDVEESFDWARFGRADYRISNVAALEAFHQSHRAIGVRPIYLLTYPMLMDEDCRTFCRAALRDGAELGLHLHSWATPPFWEQPNVFTSYQCNLPQHVERRKLQVLAQLFSDAFGFAPTIHRAGRWGGNERTAGLLEEMGVTVDLSPSSGYRGSPQGAPDFCNLDGHCFWSGPQRQVLTVPMTALSYSRGPLWLSRWRRRHGHLATGKPVRLSPEEADNALLTDMITTVVGRGASSLVYNLHSTSLYDGGNPYSRTPGSAAAIVKRSLEVLGHAMANRLVQPITAAVLWEREALDARIRHPREGGEPVVRSSAEISETARRAPGSPPSRG